MQLSLKVCFQFIHVQANSKWPPLPRTIVKIKRIKDIKLKSTVGKNITEGQ